MQTKMSLPLESRYFPSESKLRLSAQKRAIIDWAEVDDHHAILDAGCTDSSLLTYYIRHFRIRACGMVTDNSRGKIIKDELGNQAEILNADRLDIPWRDSSFHSVFIAFPLRNHPETGLFLKEILRVLKNQGQLLISTPCIPLLTQLGIKVGSRQDSYILTDPYQLMRLLDSCGFSDISMRISRLNYATVTARKNISCNEGIPAVTANRNA